MGDTLQIQLSPWVRVAITRVFALGPALAVATATISNQKLFNSINEYLNILQSVQLPFAMLPVLHFASQRTLLGPHRSGAALMTVSTFLALLVIAASVTLVCQFLQALPPAAFVGVCAYGALYSAVCVRMVWTELVAVAQWAGQLGGCCRRPAVPE